MRRRFIVYLFTQVAGMFRELKALSGDSELVLPGRGSSRRPFAKNALNKALEGLTFDMDPLTIHDLRRTGDTLLTEHGFNRDVIEKALSRKAVAGSCHLRSCLVRRSAQEDAAVVGNYVDSIVTESKATVGDFSGVA